ncbi:hypothetical protein NP493_334g03023 [Ridgeia piscesae]|uniref:LIM/homeobox protein Awh n=1 Tax=Ridgeia piscesae TaxID=27915 RepID=A0AAD9L4R9_RIDPI|nr:hypothetical protein NP493_334g03023 [Ridgeia piscesae]
MIIYTYIHAYKYLIDVVAICREFGTKCSKCLRGIQSTDWVRRAKDHVYHLACFACDSCKRQLSTGEEFALQDHRVLCKTHYIEVIEGGFSNDEGSSQKQKAKRVRTTFTEEQLQVLQANFQLDSNPDGQDLERIAQITGLSKRVTQVWFQNSRARQKKHQQGGVPGGHHHHHHHHRHHQVAPHARLSGEMGSIGSPSPDASMYQSSFSEYDIDVVSP